MTKILWIYALCTLILLGQCKNFNLQTNGTLTSAEILEEVAHKCHLSLIYTDKLAEDFLTHNKPRLIFKNLNLDEVLKLLIQEFDLFFTLKNKVLKIGMLQSKTYDLNYVSTLRKSSSNTDIIFSQNLSNAQSTFGGEGTQPNYGKSGTKISSTDENDFWNTLDTELKAMLYRPEDRHSPKQDNTNIIINKNAGLITITATQAQHKRIQDYIQRINKKSHAQVLIDVHIYLIKHSKSKTSGINWDEFYNLGNIALTGATSQLPSLLQIQNSSVNFGINVFSQGVNLNRIVEFLEKYGETRSLSNPKILTLNNQPAIISVGSVLRYSQQLIYQSNTSNANIQNSTQNYPSIFAGVLLDITPSIQNDEIILKINPSITRTKNASIENESNALQSPPNLSTNQLSSIVKLQNGQKVVLGGLISNFKSNRQYKVPILGDIPLLNLLFRYKWDTDYTEEMVIIITPKIIQPHNQPFKQDPKIQEKLETLIKEARFES
ncbi:pilus (MSHA type) biogenesis protein MshL [Helicobacter enhydrae]|uniref:Pilus (MSHA type) biogenesis protein MshL n=1 Tax=Helicobacter enhydrae TaxID=222136 RepID=A0A1B1U6B1_9HELI|nr:pilus (MSHA type) biogenesis protein MshL [Helicobacter enhydrae]ANV98280.1 pilus (MSHA type) biogenesis protein MshL [Helicobacter enhydrae]